MSGGDLNLDDLLAGINLDPLPAGNGAGNKANTAAKKGNNVEKKVKPLFDTIYEGFTVRPLSPPAGEKKTWSRVAKNSMPFDGPKLVEMATVFQQKTGRGPASHYRELSSNQQGIIDRVLEERRLEEFDADAVWELFNVRPIEKEVSKTAFRVQRAVMVLEVIICRKDRRKGGLVDKPKCSTTNPQRVQEVIDLSTPITVKVKKVVEKKKVNNNKAPELSPDDFMDLFGPPEKASKKVQNDRQPAVQQQQQHHHHQQQHQQQIPPNPDPNRYAWNGEFYQDMQQPLPYPDQQHWDPHFHPDPRFAPQHQHQQQQQQQHPHHMPPAPMPMRIDQNPFQPYGTHPEQFATRHYPDMPYDPRDYNDRRSRSRSRSRHRQRSRPRSRHHSRQRYQRYAPSMTSSEAEWYSDFTPPSTPPNDEFLMSAGAFHRRKGQRYYRDKRTPYRDERVEIRPGVSSRIDQVEDLDRLPLRPRPILVHDDYPRPKRRIANYAETYEDADFVRNRPRERGMDMLREEGRARRREDRRYEPRRF